jgi:hypothetical protein
MVKSVFRNFIQTNFDLEDKFREVNIPLRGIYNKDNLPFDIKNGFYVINLDDSKGTGTHWTGFLRSKNNIFYFDSYGLPPPSEVMKILKPLNVYYNDKIIQHINTSSCGYWVIAFSCWMYHVKSESSDPLDHYQKFLNLFDDKNQIQNEVKLKEFLKPF